MNERRFTQERRQLELARLRGQKATLIGLGARTNIALARYLVAHGAEVTLSERRRREALQTELQLLGDLPVKLITGSDHVAEALAADVVYLTPGASRAIPAVQQALAASVPVSSEIDLLFKLCPARIIGITGSSGKSTTTTLCGEILKQAGFRVYVGGNIGTPLIERVDEMTETDLVVLELSSFQLEAMTVGPEVAAILNITPNHLDRHPSMEHYSEAKRNLIRYQTEEDWTVLGYDNELTRSYAETVRGRRLFFSLQSFAGEGAYLDGGRVWLRLDGRELAVLPVDEIRLRGEHNMQNVTAAVAITAAAGAPPQAMADAIARFSGIEHRLEFVRNWRGASYYNDSIATAPERALAALRSFPEPLVMVAGGRDKHLPLEELAETIKARVHTLVLFGEAADLLAAAMQKVNYPAAQLKRCRNMEEAVALAAEAARPGDVVLLTPAFTSYDLYRDFEERGRHFKRLVEQLGDQAAGAGHGG